MKNKFLSVFIILIVFTSCSKKSNNISILNNELGSKLVVNGEDFMINGMNWDYFPIGTNHTYSLWSQPDDLIKEALDAEMTLLKDMGVNTIRVYTGIQPKWITHIYENFGIYTMLNHPFGRYGLSINGEWVDVTNYRDANTQKILIKEVSEMAETYKNTKGLLLFLLGNENNYGLFWAGSETEDFPDDEKEKKAIGEQLGRPMYKTMNLAALAIKSIDASHPVAICNGDLLYLNIIAEECKDVDIFGTNMYRGKSFGDAFNRVKKELNKPILFTEFGSDAYNVLTKSEDQKMQVFYNLENWKEIYGNAFGLGQSGNSIGGFTFQFSDGWWKYKQDKYLDIHNTIATWSNNGYDVDFENGRDNMNEEWFGICAKGPTNTKGLYRLSPRAAYYTLQEVHQFNPYQKGVTLDAVLEHFTNISIDAAIKKAQKQ